MLANSRILGGVFYCKSLNFLPFEISTNVNNYSRQFFPGRHLSFIFAGMTSQTLLKRTGATHLAVRPLVHLRFHITAHPQQSGNC